MSSARQGNLPHPVRTDLVAEAVEAGGEGVVWTLGAGADLNANLVRFGAGRGVGEHVNEEVDVVLVGVSGSGFVEVEGEEHALDAGKLVFIPRGSRRSTRGGPEGFAYLTVHRRRGTIRIGPLHRGSGRWQEPTKESSLGRWNGIR